MKIKIKRLLYDNILKSGNKFLPVLEQETNSKIILVSYLRIPNFNLMKKEELKCIF